MLSNKVAHREGDLPFNVLLGDLRSGTMATWAPPVGGAAGALSHVVIHGLDITTTLGLSRTAEDRATELVLDSLTTGGVTAHFDTMRWSLSATDLDWESGDGKPLAASAGDLVLALAGRPRPGIELRETDPRRTDSGKSRTSDGACIGKNQQWQNSHSHIFFCHNEP
ncbi:hypothetical protein [Paenarthrobacter sp. PH39-S1]|uniref:hypothetical protein n=1 Tax=Paenarthrobacter sp. PH39-S1 TaxID=3046204 RepID=UPI0024B89AF3|nr:hypothetical protein [Paenarthrobacter sp. PH39-S1]MDJ0356687.1 hypothetical protein [Paenarthrobacter sp. PH39-S1]